MATKIHDIGETTLMKAVYNPAMIHVTAIAKGDLENGRFAILSPATEEVAYPADATAKKLYFVKGIEILYDSVRESLTNFYTPANSKVRIFEVSDGDNIGTTAFKDVVDCSTLVVGTAYEVNNAGQLVTYVDGAWKFTVVDKWVIGDLAYGIVHAQLV